MKCRLVELYKDGERLPREAVLGADPLIGELIVSGRPQESGTQRHSRIADLVLVTPGCKRPLLRPLFEPTIIRMSEGEGGFVLRGWQNRAYATEAGHAVTEFAQEWWVRT